MFGLLEIYALHYRAAQIRLNPQLIGLSAAHEVVDCVERMSKFSAYHVNLDSLLPSNYLSQRSISIAVFDPSLCTVSLLDIILQ
jgi:hypothetical protein